MRWVIRTGAFLTVMSWMVVVGLLARPVGSANGVKLPSALASSAHARPLPVDWSRRVVAGSSELFPGVGASQTAGVISIVERHARRFQLDPLMVLAVIHVES